MEGMTLEEQWREALQVSCPYCEAVVNERCFKFSRNGYGDTRPREEAHRPHSLRQTKARWGQ